MTSTYPDTRYVVAWTPEADVVRECRAAGMRENDGTSCWDWIEPTHCEMRREFATFAEAVAFARSVMAADIWRSPWVYLQHLVNDADDLGNVFASKHWEDDCKWCVEDGEPVDEDRPDELLAA